MSLSRLPCLAGLPLGTPIQAALPQPNTTHLTEIPQGLPESWELAGRQVWGFQLEFSYGLYPPTSANLEIQTTSKLTHRRPLSSRECDTNNKELIRHADVTRLTIAD